LPNEGIPLAACNVRGGGLMKCVRFDHPMRKAVAEGTKGAIASIPDLAGT